MCFTITRIIFETNASVRQYYLWVVKIVFTVLCQFRVVFKQNIVLFVYENARKFAETHILTQFKNGTYENMFSQHRICSNNVCIHKEMKMHKT